MEISFAISKRVCKRPTILQRFDCDFEMLCSGASRSHAMRAYPCDLGARMKSGSGVGGRGELGAEPLYHL